MDWFDPAEDAAAEQARKLNHALKMGGRVLLRSASIDPWYIKQFEESGFSPCRVGSRFPGTCIDRSVFVLMASKNFLMCDSVNMYASTWICTKTSELQRPTTDGSRGGHHKKVNSVEHLELWDTANLEATVIYFFSYLSTSRFRPICNISLDHWSSIEKGAINAIYTIFVNTYKIWN